MEKRCAGVRIIRRGGRRGEARSGEARRSGCGEGQPFFKATRKINDGHQIEEVGKKLRAMMPWIQKEKMVDKDKN